MKLFSFSFHLGFIFIDYHKGKVREGESSAPFDGVWKTQLRLPKSSGNEKKRNTVFADGVNVLCRKTLFFKLSL